MRSMISSCDRRQLRRGAVLHMARHAMQSLRLQPELRCLQRELCVTSEELMQAFMLYDEDVYAYGNEVYDSVAIRFVLYLHNHIEGSWHIERQEILREFVSYLGPSSLVDIGYGVPGAYVRTCLFADKDCHITLLDKYASARRFSASLLNKWSKEWYKKITLGEIDLDHENNGLSPFDAYIFFDSIEHASEPDKAFERIVTSAPPHAAFILSLPVGPRVPVHFKEWATEEHVFCWLQQYPLSIIKTERTFPKPEVDLFAKSLGGSFHNVMVLCART